MWTRKQARPISRPASFRREVFIGNCPAQNCMILYKADERTVGSEQPDEEAPLSVPCPLSTPASFTGAVWYFSVLRDDNIS